MKKTFRYRLYPTSKQEYTMKKQLSLCAELYNAALQKRRDAYRMSGISITFMQQSAQLPAIKGLCPEYDAIYSQVLQDVLHRVDKAFKVFFRRGTAGEKPGYPRFKSRLPYDSLTYPQTGFGIDEQGKLSLSKIGHMKMVQHHPLKGAVKTCTIVKSATGKWYCCFSCDEVPQEVLPPSENQVGIDVGLKEFAPFSTGESISNLRFFREEEDALARTPRRIAKGQKGTPERAAQRRGVARIHERIRWRREDFAHQQSRRIVNRFGLIVVEVLLVRSMLKNPRLAKAISDAAWSAFFTHLLSKAVEAAREIVRVSPAYTSQTCSACGHRQQTPLSVRVYERPNCSFVIDRDHNASLNILQSAVGRHCVKLGL